MNTKCHFQRIAAVRTHRSSTGARTKGWLAGGGAGGARSLADPSSRGSSMIWPNIITKSPRVTGKACASQACR